MEAKWEYQTDKVVIIPYVPEKKKYFPETFLVSLYSRLVEDGTLKVTFPGMDVASLNKFIAYLHRRSVLMFHFKTEDGKVGEPFGFAWICEVEGKDGARKASFGFAIFRKFWGRVENRHACMLAIYWWFTALKIDILYATTLVKNKLAQNYAKNFGFKVIGVMPKFFIHDGELVDVVLRYLEKDYFLKIYEAWRAQISPFGVLGK